MKTYRIILAAMAVLLAAACGNNTVVHMQYDHPERYSLGGVSLGQPVSSINIDWYCGDVDIRYYDGSDVRVYERSDSTLPDYLQMRYRLNSDGELDIRFCKSGKYRNGELNNLNKLLIVEVPRGIDLAEIELDGVEVRMTIEQVVSRQLTVDGVKINVNAYYDTLPNEIDFDAVKGLLALHLLPSAGLTIDQDGVMHHLVCDLPARKEGKSTVVGDGRCKVDVDGVDVSVSIRKRFVEQ